MEVKEGIVRRRKMYSIKIIFLVEKLNFAYFPSILLESDYDFLSLFFETFNYTTLLSA